MTGNGKQLVGPIDTIIGARIKQGRQIRGLSREALAQQIEVTAQQLHKYEAGTNKVSAARLKRIAEALRLSPASFYEPLDSDSPPALARVDPEAAAMMEVLAGIPDAITRRRLVAFTRGLKEDLLAAEARIRSDIVEELRRDGRIRDEAAPDTGAS